MLSSAGVIWVEQERVVQLAETPELRAFGRALKQAREESGLSLRALAASEAQDAGARLAAAAWVTLEIAWLPACGRIAGGV